MREDKDVVGSPQADALESDLDALMRASRVIAGVVAESIAHTGDLVTMPQLRALVLVATRSDVNVSAVAASLDVHPSNATRLLDRLVQAGLLQRSESTTDRRNLVLSLTANGSRLIDSVMHHRRTAYRRILQAMTPRQRHALGRALEAFAQAAGEPGEHLLPTL
ncbi:MAG TPA: MarR family transcriptional regulator [Microlunatus sp.]|nr:MarR family transcriptional regulator [Microlunatus sp.]